MSDLQNDHCHVAMVSIRCMEQADSTKRMD